MRSNKRKKIFTHSDEGEGEGEEEDGQEEGVDRKKSSKNISEIDELINELHTPARIRYPRRSFIYRRFGDLQSDLADLSSIKSYNSGVSFILVIICTLSKMVWLKPLKTKKAEEVVNQFRSAINEMKFPPKTLMTDRGESGNWRYQICLN